MSDQITEKKFTCIMCPLGCEVTLKLDENGEIKETLGNKCTKGKKYAAGELRNPTRVLTSTVAIEGAPFVRLPVRTSAPIPKSKIFDCMKLTEKAKVSAPITIGDAVIKNILHLGIDVIATRNM